METTYKLPQEMVEKAAHKHAESIAQTISHKIYSRDDFKSGVKFTNETYSPLLSQMKEALEASKDELEKAFQNLEYGANETDLTNAISLATAALESLSKYEVKQ